MIVNSAEKNGIKKEQAYFMVGQRLQENGWRTAVPGNNLFNLKGKGTAGTIILTTKEEDKNGNSTTIKDGFRNYNTPEEGIADYLSQLEKNFPKAYNALLNGGTINEFADGLLNGVKGSFATDKDYKESLMRMYEQAKKEMEKLEEEKKNKEKNKD